MDTLNGIEIPPTLIPDDATSWMALDDFDDFEDIEMFADSAAKVAQSERFS